MFLMGPDARDRGEHNRGHRGHDGHLDGQIRAHALLRQLVGDEGNHDQTPTNA